MISRMIPNFADVQAAAVRIAPHAVRTPLVESWQLNALTGGRVFLKMETLQRTRSFQVSGARKPLALIPGKGRAQGGGGFFFRKHCPGGAGERAFFCVARPR